MTGAHIVSTTLPTVIGMGVVSKSTETMFGKGGRRKTKKSTAAKRGKATTKWRKANWHPTKATAEKDARYFKRAGHRTKVVRAYNRYFKKWGYTVYTAQDYGPKTQVG